MTPPRTAACAACSAVSPLHGKGAAKRIRSSGDGKPNPPLDSAPQRTTAEQVAGVRYRRFLLFRAEARDDARAQDGGERPRGCGRRVLSSPPPARRGDGGEAQLGGGNAHGLGGKAELQISLTLLSALPPRLSLWEISMALHELGTRAQT